MTKIEMKTSAEFFLNVLSFSLNLLRNWTLKKSIAQLFLMFQWKVKFRILAPNFDIEAFEKFVIVTASYFFPSF